MGIYDGIEDKAHSSVDASDEEREKDFQEIKMVRNELENILGQIEDKEKNHTKFVNCKKFYKGLYLEDKSANEISKQYNGLFQELSALFLGCIGVFKGNDFEILKAGILDLIDWLKLEIINYKNV